MAGQPPDGTWQAASPNGQDQVRAAWQAPPPYEQASYEAYPPPQQHQQSYSQGAHGYGGAQEDQHTMAWDQPSQESANAGWQAPAPGHAASWQAPGQGPGNAAYQAPSQAAGHGSRSRAASHGKGFVASLFDFGFNSFVTPKVVKGLYALAAVWTVFVGIWLLLVGIRFGGGNAGTVIFMLIGIAVFGLLSLGSIRVFLELFMALHRINENIQVLRDRGNED